MRAAESAANQCSSSSLAGSAASSFASSVSMALRGSRSFLSIKRNQVVSMENSQEQELQELDLFQASVAQRLRSLYPSFAPDRLETLQEEGEEEADGGTLHQDQDAEGGDMKRKKPDSDEFLVTITFLRKLMEVLLGCEEEFRALLLSRSLATVSKTPVDRLVTELLDRWVKSLDICNAVTESLDSLRFSHRHAEIAAAALVAPPPLLGGDAQLVRARNALAKLLPLLSVEDRSSTPTDRAWSFGRSSRGASSAGTATRVPQRTLSLKLSRAWSAAKQLSAMASSLTPPKGADGGSAALSLCVYTMSSILVFAMWVLIAAFPTQERAPAPPLPSPPRQLPWAAPLAALQERLAEDWKKKDRKGSSSVMPAGLMGELQRMERAGKALMEADPADCEWAVQELAESCKAISEELGHFRRLVREVFHRFVKGRAEVLEFLAQGTIGSSSSSTTC